MDGSDFRRALCVLAAGWLLGAGGGTGQGGDAVAAQRPGYAPAVESYLPRGARVMNARLLAVRPASASKNARCA